MYNDEKLNLIYIARKAKESELIRKFFGAISFLGSDKNNILITPKDMDAFKLRPDDIIVINHKGDEVENINNRELTEYLDLHLMAYDVREENVDTVMHINPKEASQRADEEHRVVFLSDCINPDDHEDGDIALLIKDPISHRDYMLIKNNGVLVVGKGLFETLEKAKYIENISKIKMPKEKYAFDEKSNQEYESFIEKFKKEEY